MYYLYILWFISLLLLLLLLLLLPLYFTPSVLKLANVKMCVRNGYDGDYYHYYSLLNRKQ